MSDKLTAEQIAEIAGKAYADPVFFLQFFLPHLFPNEVPWVHRGILAILTRKTDFLLNYGELDKIITNFVWCDDPLAPDPQWHSLFTPELDEAGNIVALHLRVTKYSSLMLPRGYSKTTLAGIGVVLYWILYQDKKFPVYISESATHAEMQLGNVRAELEGNERIISVFGYLVPDRQSSLKWSGDIIQTTTGVTVVARGRGGQVRGLNMNGNRPDCIVLDDVEDRDSVKTEEQRQKARQWFYGDVLPALPEMKENATILALGTLLHGEALLMTMHKDPQVTSIIFGVKDRQGDLLWEANMSEAKIESKKQQFVRAGQLSQYYMEYENTIRAVETQLFKPEQLIVSPKSREDMLAVAIALDPAISKKRRADYRAIAVVGMTNKGIIQGLDFWADKEATPREVVDKYFEMAVRWDCTLHGVEANAFQAVLIHIMKEEMFRKAKVLGPKAYFEIIPITHSATDGKKEDRITGILQPRFAAGYIHMQRRFPLLETQLQDFPNGKRDLPDVLAMAVHLLNPAAPAAAGVDDLAEDEMESLDEVFDGDWRRY